MVNPYLLVGPTAEARLPALINEAALVGKIREVLPIPGFEGRLFAGTSAELKAFVLKWQELLRGRVEFGPVKRVTPSLPGGPKAYPPYACSVKNIALGLLLFMGVGLGVHIMERRSSVV